jgi:hypothetical protein
MDHREINPKWVTYREETVKSGTKEKNVLRVLDGHAPRRALRELIRVIIVIVNEGGRRRRTRLEVRLGIRVSKVNHGGHKNTHRLGLRQTDVVILRALQVVLIHNVMFTLRRIRFIITKPQVFVTYSLQDKISIFQSSTSFKHVPVPINQTGP